MADIPKLRLSVETKAEHSLTSHIIRELVANPKIPNHIRNWAAMIEVDYISYAEPKPPTIRNMKRGDGEFIVGGDDR